MQWHVASTFALWACNLNHDATPLPMTSNVGVLAWQRRMGILIPEGEPEQASDRLGLLFSGRLLFFPPCDTTSQKKPPQVREPWYRGGDYLFSFPHFIKNSKSIRERKFVVLKDSTQKNWRYKKKTKNKLVFNGSKGKSNPSVQGWRNEWTLSDLYIMHSHRALKRQEILTHAKTRMNLKTLC